MRCVECVNGEREIVWIHTRHDIRNESIVIVCPYGADFVHDSLTMYHQISPLST